MSHMNSYAMHVEGVFVFVCVVWSDYLAIPYHSNPTLLKFSGRRNRRILASCPTKMAVDTLQCGYCCILSEGFDIAEVGHGGGDEGVQ
jgi:hypothetical protein